MDDQVDPENLIFRYLDTVGDGSGIKNAAANYSSTPQEFVFAPEKSCVISRMIISIGDDQGMRQNGYGGRRRPLENGWSLIIENKFGGVAADLTDGMPITTNAGIGQLCYDVDVKSWGRGPERLLARWTFAKTGRSVFLKEGYRLILTLNDNFSFLTDHYFSIQGYYEQAQ